MVQVLPQATHLGAQIGQGLGQGLQRGSEIGFQRGLTQNALQGLTNLPAGASPLEATKYLLQATAGLPDQGRILQALAPYLVGQNRTANVFGAAGGNQLPPGQQQPQTPGAQGSQPAQQQYGGFLAQEKTPEEINAFATNYARNFPEDPAAYLRGQKIAQTENKTIQGAREDLLETAQKQFPELKKRPERLPLFSEELQKFSHLKDRNQILKNARESFRETTRSLDNLENGYAPGAVRGAIRKAHGALGLTSAFTQGGQTREDAIKGLSNSVKDLIDKGYEQDARNILAQKHQLSPTEIEELIHPLSEKNLHSLKRLPDANNIPAAAHSQELDKFIKSNLTPETSLLALRHRLWDEKGYDWQEIAQAMDKFKDQFNERQNIELQTVDNDPPIQSLSDIFRGWDRLTSYLSGAK